MGPRLSACRATARTFFCLHLRLGAQATSITALYRATSIASGCSGNVCSATGATIVAYYLIGCQLTAAYKASQYRRARVPEIWIRLCVRLRPAKPQFVVSRQEKREIPSGRGFPK
jgi:hypothetical protein